MKWLLIFLVMTHLIARIKKTPSTMHYGLCTLYATLMELAVIAFIFVRIQ